MKPKISKLPILLAAGLLSFAGVLSADATWLELGVGYRQDSITWNVKERGTLNPRTEVDLHFKDLEIFLINLRGKSTLGGCCDSYVRIDADYGWIFDGKCREKTEKTRRHQRDTREFRHGGYTEEGHYHSVVLHNDVKNGNSFVWDLDLGFAYPIEWGCSENFKIAPAIGFALNSQHIRVKDRSKYGEAIHHSDSSDSDHHHRHYHTRKSGSHFRTQMWGPWVGFDFTYNNESFWNLYGEFELHFGRARRHRDSSLGNKYFDHYTRTKFFWGPSIKVGADYVFCECWYADASVQYSKYFSDANRDNFDWASASIKFDVGYLF